jgi:hypothetical protein
MAQKPWLKVKPKAFNGRGLPELEMPIPALQISVDVGKTQG